MVRPLILASTAYLAGICFALPTDANQRNRNFFMTIPSGAEIEAQQVGVGFYDEGSDGQNPPVYEIAAQFVVVDTGGGLTRSVEYYGADTTQIDVSDDQFAQLVEDTRLVCLVTHAGVRRAIPRSVVTLDAKAIDAITEHPPSFYKVIIEFFPNRENTSRDGYEPDRVEVVHDLRDGSCDALSPDELPPIPSTSG